MQIDGVHGPKWIIYFLASFKDCLVIEIKGIIITCIITFILIILLFLLVIYFN